MLILYHYNQASPDGRYPVHIAATKGDVHSITLLSQYKAHLDQITKTGKTALFIAANCGYVPVIKALAGKVDITAGATAAYIAAYKGHVQVMLELIKQGADVNIPFTSNPFTPAHIATSKGFTAILTTIANKADLDRVTKGFTPLFLAAGDGHFNTVVELRKLGANPSIECQLLADDLMLMVSASGIEVKARMSKFISLQTSTKDRLIKLKACDIAKIMGHDNIAHYLSTNNKREIPPTSPVSPQKMQVSIFYLPPTAQAREALGVLHSNNLIQNHLNYQTC